MSLVQLAFLPNGTTFVPFNNGMLSTKIYKLLGRHDNSEMSVSASNGCVLQMPPNKWVESLHETCDKKWLVHPQTMTFINENFVIRITSNNSLKSYLRGAGQYHKEVGYELAFKHFEKVLHSTTDKVTIQLRRGLKIEFCSK